jgi:phosphonate transport system substrate-binding protein
VFARVIVSALLLAVYLTGSAQAPPVKIAIFPASDPGKLQTAMDILADYLRKATGDQVVALVARDYTELAQRLHEGSVDIA